MNEIKTPKSNVGIQYINYIKLFQKEYYCFFFTKFDFKDKLTN